MRYFSKFSTDPTRRLCTRTFGYSIRSVSTIFDQCYKWATDDVKRRGKPLIPLLVHRAALQRLQAMWLKRSRGQESRFRKQSEEEKATLVKQCQELKASLLKQCEEKAALLAQSQEKVRLLKKCKNNTSFNHSSSYVVDSWWLNHWNWGQKLPEERIDPTIKQHPDPPVGMPSTPSL